MKKEQEYKSTKNKSENMPHEYDFDYKKSHSNRFAARINKDQLFVILDKDVSRVFTTQEAVNETLRLFINIASKSIKRKALA